MMPFERRRLARVREVRHPIHAAALVEQLQDDAAASPWLDARDLEELRALVADHGLAPRADLVPAPLAAGDSWLLLCAPGAPVGSVRRVRLAAEPATDADPLAASRAHVERAKRGLARELGRHCRALDDELWTRGFLANVDHTERVVGGSLGLATCAALVSRALRRPPAPAIAASAAVADDGRLLPVDELAGKLAALAERHPEIASVVVAADQPEPPRSTTHTIIRSATLASALTALGLPLADLRETHVEEHLQRVAGFESDNKSKPSVERWRALGWQAVESAEVLAAVAGSRDATDAGLRGRGWAALFFLHAGDVELAMTQLVSVSDADALALGIAAWKKVIEVSALIDVDPQRALAVSHEALALARDDDRVLAGALGTHGRALVHAGRAADAEPFLRDAVARQERTRRSEVPRSSTYLATCLRRQGRAAEALAIADGAIALAIELAGWKIAATSLLYLHLERGRALLDLDRAADAIAAFEAVVAGGHADADYPRSGGLRGLARAYRATGDDVRADAMLVRCVEVARTAPVVMRRVAALAIADVLVAQVATSVAPAALRDAWRAAFGDRDPAEALRAEIY